MRARKSFCRLARFGLTTANASQLAQFYEDAFGCRRVAAEHLSGADFEKLMKVEGQAERVTLLLGREAIELVQFGNPGRPYPVNSSASDLIFQHFAIVVSDMTKAFQRLCAVEGWSSITLGARNGYPNRPAVLPPSNSGTQRGIRLSSWRSRPETRRRNGAQNAPAVFSWVSIIPRFALPTPRSAARFTKTFALRSWTFLNRGAEQEKLDDVPEVRLDVIAIAPTDPTPHIELLCYRSGLLRNTDDDQSNDIAATRLVLALDSDSTPRSRPRSGRAPFDYCSRCRTAGPR